jgi:hypothetical protein
LPTPFSIIFRLAARLWLSESKARVANDEKIMVWVVEAVDSNYEKMMENGVGKRL